MFYNQKTFSTRTRKTSRGPENRSHFSFLTPPSIYFPLLILLTWICSFLQTIWLLQSSKRSHMIMIMYFNLFSCKEFWMLSKTDSQQINSGSAPGNFTLSPKQKEIKAGNFFSSGPQRLFQIKKKLRWEILWKLTKTNIYLCHDVFKNITVLFTYNIWQYFHFPPEFYIHFSNSTSICLPFEFPKFWFLSLCNKYLPHFQFQIGNWGYTQQLHFQRKHFYENVNCIHSSFTIFIESL